MISHYAKKMVTISLLLLPLLSCANSNESYLNCSQTTSIEPLISQLDASLRENSKEYIVHYQNESSGWVFESYLFVGESQGRYVITSVGSKLPKKETVISESYFYELLEEVLEVTRDKENSRITPEEGYCQYIDVKKKGERNTVVLTEMSSDFKLRNLRKKLDALIIYRKE